MQPAATLAILLRAATSIALILVGAKLHGRQVRLQREAAGVMQVDFRRANGPVVEAIWRRDRRTFWPTFGVLAGAGVAVATFATRAGALDATIGWCAFAVATAFAASFAIAAIAAQARRGRGHDAAGDRTDAAGPRAPGEVPDENLADAIRATSAHGSTERRADVVGWVAFLVTAALHAGAASLPT